MVNIYIVYDLKSNLNSLDLIIENYLFGTINGLKALKVINNNGDAYGLGDGIAFDSKGKFSHPTGGIGQNIIIFGADMSSSIHANNKKEEGIIQIGITLYTEKMYSINFTETNEKLSLNLH